LENLGSRRGSRGATVEEGSRGLPTCGQVRGQVAGVTPFRNGEGNGTMARPLKAIDAEQVVKIGRLGCTVEEIAEVLGCSPRTIHRRFRHALVRARASAKMSLRRAQYVRATRDRSDRMLIWLGRIELGQTYGGDGGGELGRLLVDLLAKGEEGET
jgi:AraC-like DNA-binding protein